MTNMSRVTATHGANCTRVAASSSPHAAGGAPGGVPPAVALDPTSETVKGAPTDSLAAVLEPSDGRSRPVADSGGSGPATVSDATSPGEVAGPIGDRGAHASPGGSTSTQPPFLDDVTWLAIRSTVVKVRGGIL